MSLHDPLQSLRAQVRIIGYLIHNRHETGKLVAGSIRQNSRHARRLHLCIGKMQLDKARIDIFLRKRDEGLFD